jgi:hypothetical protein
MNSDADIRANAGGVRQVTSSGPSAGPDRDLARSLVSATAGRGRPATRRRGGLSEIDAEIRTLEGEFANVIYLATER